MAGLREVNILGGGSLRRRIFPSFGRRGGRLIVWIFPGVGGGVRCFLGKFPEKYMYDKKIYVGNVSRSLSVCFILIFKLTLQENHFNASSFEL